MIQGCSRGISARNWWSQRYLAYLLSVLVLPLPSHSLEEARLEAELGTELHLDQQVVGLEDTQTGPEVVGNQLGVVDLQLVGVGSQAEVGSQVEGRSPVGVGSQAAGVDSLLGVGSQVGLDEWLVELGEARQV